MCKNIWPFFIVCLSDNHLLFEVLLCNTWKVSFKKELVHVHIHITGKKLNPGSFQKLVPFLVLKKETFSFLYVLSFSKF